jgi:hypothetical protein
MIHYFIYHIKPYNQKHEKYNGIIIIHWELMDI